LLLKKEFNTKSGKLQKLTLMISDFGTAIFREKVFGSLRTGATGTPEWMPPEAWDIENNYDSRYDIWGLGLVLYYLNFRKLPWKHSRNAENFLKEEIKYGKINIPVDHGISKEVISVIEILTEHDLLKRPTSRELLVSPLMQNIIRIIGNPLHFQENSIAISQISNQTIRKTVDLRSALKQSKPLTNTPKLVTLPSSTQIPIEPVIIKQEERVNNHQQLFPTVINDSHKQSLKSSSSFGYVGVFNGKNAIQKILFCLLIFVLKSSIFMWRCFQSGRDVVFMSVCLAATCLCFIFDKNLFLTCSGIESIIFYILFFSGKLICDSNYYFLYAYTLLSILSTSVFIWFSKT